MVSPLNKSNVNEIVQSALKQHLSFMKTQMGDIKVEIKVIHEEVRKMSWEIEQVKDRLTALES